MLMIAVRFKGADSTKCSRLVVSSGTKRVVVPWKYNLSTDQMYGAALAEFGQKFGLRGTLYPLEPYKPGVRYYALQLEGAADSCIALQC